MSKQYTQLSHQERVKISFLQEQGYSLRKIASTLHRSTSTISREIKRNLTPAKHYHPDYAHQATSAKRWRGSKLDRDPLLRNQVLHLLKNNLSPEQIAGYLKFNSHLSISYQSIYRFIYHQVKRHKDYSWRNYLPLRRAKPRSKKSSNNSSTIRFRTSVHQRSSLANLRSQFGHWEADLMAFSQYNQYILVLIERKSRFIITFKLFKKHSTPIIQLIQSALDSLPKQLARSVTFDNGSEFAHHFLLHQLNITTFFCDTYSPWQKGAVENSIGRLRRFLPKSTNLKSVSNSMLDRITAYYNLSPRKCLNFHSPAHIFFNKLLHFKCESTIPAFAGMTLFLIN